MTASEQNLIIAGEISKAMLLLFLEMNVQYLNNKNEYLQNCDFIYSSCA